MQEKILRICKYIKGCRLCIEKYSNLAFITDRLYAVNWPPETCESSLKERQILSVDQIAQISGRLLVQNFV